MVNNQNQQVCINELNFAFESDTLIFNTAINCLLLRPASNMLPDYSQLIAEQSNKQQRNAYWLRGRLFFSENFFFVDFYGKHETSFICWFALF